MLSQKIPNYIALFSENVPKKHANRKYPRKYGHQDNQSQNLLNYLLPS